FNTFFCFLLSMCSENSLRLHAWWCVPVIPAPWEAEAGRSLRGSGLRCAMSIGYPVPLTAQPVGS
uniref:Uncharacterized protein n=1 Tax=Chrysemys picta bellii TaxID=8478 RepID=A0A8C3HD65_CHRPI